jgi:hypothetical protein
MHGQNNSCDNLTEALNSTEKQERVTLINCDFDEIPNEISQLKEKGMIELVIKNGGLRYATF